MKFIQTVESSKKGVLFLYSLIVSSTILYVYTNAIILREILAPLITILGWTLAFYIGFAGTRNLKLGLLQTGLNGIISMFLTFVTVFSVGLVYAVIVNRLSIAIGIASIVAIIIFSLTGFVAAVAGASLEHLIRK